MVLESLNITLLEKRPVLGMVIGLVYTLLGYWIARIFFPNYISLPMLFLSTLLLIPSLMKLLSVEEQRERRDGLYHFFKDHRDVAEIYIFLFLGIFIAYLVLGLFFVSAEQSFSTVFGYQMEFLQKQEGLSAELITGFLDAPPTYTFQNFLALFEYNLKVGLIFFVLSVVYGAGAIFLTVLNASVFAGFAAYLIDFLAKRVAQVYSVLGMMMIHILPEMAGFLLASIAGGVISKAIIREKWGSQEFKNVVKDGFVLLCVGIGLLFLAAWFETFVTPKVFVRLF